MYLIGLIEAGLTTLPEHLQRTKIAKSLSVRYKVPPKYLLLDVSLYYNEMRKYNIDTRYGRPDIVHQFLLAAQYSLLNLEGKLRVFVHTANDELILVRPETRIPKNYYQFVGLMQRLYMYGRAPTAGDWLLKLERNKGISQILNELGVSRPVLLHERGERLGCDEARRLSYPPSAFLIGGFPRGEFSDEVLSLVRSRYSIKGGMRLDAWVVADRLIACLEGDIL